MLYRLHNNIFIVGMLILAALITLSKGRAWSAITVFTVYAFVTQLSLFVYFLRNPDVRYSEKALFLAVLVYTLLMGALVVVVGNYFGGEEYLFEDPDGLFYYEEGLKSNSMGLMGNMSRIVTEYEFDDWGALLFCSFVLWLVPSFYFVYFIYILTGAVAAIMLFRMGKHVMPEAYAFMAALAYSTSSYIVLFHCTCLKESFFVFLVISAMYYFYKSVALGDYRALLMVFLLIVVLLSYRAAVAAFLILGFTAYYAITQRGSAVSVFLYFFMAVGFVASLAFLQSQVDHYTEGGDSEQLLAENGSANYSGGFNYFVGWFVALLGPFPTLFPRAGEIPTTITFFGAGLMFKLFLAIPMWVGVYWAVRRFDILMVPILAFVLVEVLATGYIMASFELRKVLLHIPFTYTIAYYGLYQMETNDVGTNKKRLLEGVGYLFAFGVLFLWNVIKIK